MCLRHWHQRSEAAVTREVLGRINQAFWLTTSRILDVRAAELFIVRGPECQSQTRRQQAGVALTKCHNHGSRGSPREPHPRPFWKVWTRPFLAGARPNLQTPNIISPQQSHSGPNAGARREYQAYLLRALLPVGVRVVSGCHPLTRPYGHPWMACGKPFRSSGLPYSARDPASGQSQSQATCRPAQGFLSRHSFFLHHFCSPKPIYRPCIRRHILIRLVLQWAPARPYLTPYILYPPGLGVHGSQSTRKVDRQPLSHPDSLPRTSMARPHPPRGAAVPRIRRIYTSLLLLSTLLHPVQGVASHPTMTTSTPNALRTDTAWQHERQAPSSTHFSFARKRSYKRAVRRAALHTDQTTTYRGRACTLRQLCAG